MRSSYPRAAVRVPLRCTTPHARTTPSAGRRAAGARKATVGGVALTYRRLFDLASPVQDPASAALGPRQFLLLGGLTAANTSTDTVVVAGLHSSAVRASLPNAQHDAQAAALGGRVYVFGGGQFTQYDHILTYDPVTNSIQAAGSLLRAASDVAVTGHGSTGYVIGGFDGVNWSNTVPAFTPGASPRILAPAAGRAPLRRRSRGRRLRAGRRRLDPDPGSATPSTGSTPPRAMSLSSDTRQRASPTPGQG